MSDSSLFKEVDAKDNDFIRSRISKALGEVGKSGHEFFKITPEEYLVKKFTEMDVALVTAHTGKHYDWFFSEIKTTRCTVCRSEFTDAEIASARGCPVCHTTSLPMSIVDDVTVSINWHELRILCNFAENYAQQTAKSSKPSVDAIINNLAKQYPLKTGLTLSREVADMKQLYPGIELVEGGGRDV